MPETITDGVGAGSTPPLLDSTIGGFARSPADGRPGGSRLTDLAAAARMTKQSMGALVDHLEEAGYVERVHDRLDGRVKAIRLTPRGRQAAETIAAIGAEIETAWADKIGRRRLEELRDALAAITLDLPDR